MDTLPINSFPHFQCERVAEQQNKAAEWALKIRRYIQQQREKQKSFHSKKLLPKLVHSPSILSDEIKWDG
jgi:hypothetical protein